MSIKFEEDINKDNIELLCHWSNKLGSEFQEQWTGPQYESLYRGLSK